jgi:hypothetical protein
MSAVRKKWEFCMLDLNEFAPFFGGGCWSRLTRENRAAL